jgi:hypothetical protein
MSVKAGGKLSYYSSTLKMKATRSFETSADFQQTTRRYIPEDSTLHEDLQSKKLGMFHFS